MPSNNTIAVTAASGQLGSAIIQATVDIVGKDNVVGLARTPGKAASLGVEVRPGDYTVRDQLTTSLQGIDSLLLVSGMVAPDKRIGQAMGKVVVETRTSATRSCRPPQGPGLRGRIVSVTV